MTVVEVDRERGRIGLRLSDDPAVEGKAPEELTQRRAPATRARAAAAATAAGGASASAWTAARERGRGGGGRRRH